MFVVCVEFRLQNDASEQFMQLMLKQAKTSLDVEPDCIRFDVCVDDKDPTKVFLYEIYASREAFDLHLQSEHFISFDAAVSNLVAGKEVNTYRLAV